jgi:hypothetical protein
MITAQEKPALMPLPLLAKMMEILVPLNHVTPQQEIVNVLICQMELLAKMEMHALPAILVRVVPVYPGQ